MHNPISKHVRRTFRPRVTVGAVPGQLVARDGSTSGTMRLIQYDTEHHQDVSVGSFDELLALIEAPLQRRRRRIKPRRNEQNGNSNVGLLVLDRDRDDADTTPPTNGHSVKSLLHHDAIKSCVQWINIDGVGDVELLAQLGDRFDIHPLALEDVVNVHQHAKLECYGNTLFFVARMPIPGEAFRTEQVSLFLIDGVVITIQEQPGDCLNPVRQRIANSLGRIRSRGGDYLIYALIDAIIDGYFPVLEQYAGQLDEASARLEKRADSGLPLHLHHIRADLLMIRKTVNQHRLALKDVLRETPEIISDDTALYFRDCQDHIQQLIEAADTDRETCVELRELYFALLGEKNNDVMKVLTIIATIFIPMSFVAGIYGMNFDSEASMLNMPELHWAFGYPFALSLMAVMAGGLLAYLYRKGWLTA